MKRPNEREAGRVELYKIVCTTLENKPREFNLIRDQKEWGSFLCGEKLTLIVNGFGQLVRMERSE